MILTPKNKLKSLENNIECTIFSIEQKIELIMLDLSSLDNAIKSLKKAVTRSQQNLKDEELRDASIQRFEYSFELGLKMLKRQLEQIELSEEIDRMFYKDLIRLGAEKGLICSPKSWFKFRDMRNITSHTYDQSKAEKVYEIIPDFIKEIDYLHKQLNTQNK